MHALSRCVCLSIHHLYSLHKVYITAHKSGVLVSHVISIIDGHIIHCQIKQCKRMKLLLEGL